MHKLTNFSAVRSGWDNMPFGVNRSQGDLSRNQQFPQQQQSTHQPQHQPQHQPPQQISNRPLPTHSHSHPNVATMNGPMQQSQMPPFGPATPISYCFRVPLKNTLAGPDPNSIVFASAGATEKWTFKQEELNEEDAPENGLLPVHREHIEQLRNFCASLKAESNVEATVTVGKAATLGPVPGLSTASTSKIVTNVCLHGRDHEFVRKVKEVILNQSPITLVCFLDSKLKTQAPADSVAIRHCSGQSKHVFQE
jgi:hypothetical protein